MSEINDTKELPEVTFTINLKLIQKYQRQEPIILVKYKDGTYHIKYVNFSFYILSYQYFQSSGITPNIIS